MTFSTDRLGGMLKDFHGLQRHKVVDELQLLALNQANLPILYLAIILKSECSIGC